jgi:hypothetical protein
MKQAEALHNTDLHALTDVKDSNGTHTPKDELHHLFEKAEEYFKTRKDLLQLKLVSKSSDIISSVIAKVITVVFLIFFFIILNIGLGLLIGDWLGESYYGFFALAGLYLILGLIINSVGEKMIKRPVANNLIKKFIK